RDYGATYNTWALLMSGWNSAWWWQATFLEPANAALRWDLTPTPVAADMIDAVREIRRGPGTLIAHARRQTDAIAVHYAASNWHASTIESGVGNHVNNLGLQREFWMAPHLVGQHLPADEQMQQLWAGVAPKGHYAAA